MSDNGHGSRGGARGDPDAGSQGKFPAAMLVDRLAGLEAGQAAMNGALGLMIDTLQVQTNLLRELVKYAREDTGPSPVLKSLGDLTAAVLQMDESIEAMADRFGGLSETIAAAFGLAADEAAWQPPNGEAA
jgi:hypothetical protein